MLTKVDETAQQCLVLRGCPLSALLPSCLDLFDPVRDQGGHHTFWDEGD